MIYSQILARTHRVMVGAMVTNPATRDWTVTASLFATLNEMFGNRTICGIGRGDSAVRVTNGKPTTVREMREATHVIRELANCRPVDYKGSTLQFPWASTSTLEVWVAAYGPMALKAAGEVGAGYILQLAESTSLPDDSTRSATAASNAGRDPDGSRSRCRSDVRGDDWVHIETNAAGSAAWSAPRSDIVAKYGETGDVPQALTDYIKGLEGYDYNEHGRAETSTPLRTGQIGIASACWYGR